MHKNLQLILEKMKPITLDEMRNIRLMDRIDTKFVAPASMLPLLLEKMEPFFRIQEHNGKRVAPYCTQYLDSPDLNMFTMHQNGKLNRQKIRIRSYTDSNLSFLEIKNKNNKGRTKKTRVNVDFTHINTIEDLNENKAFLAENSLFNPEKLQPSLGNNFNRITLVNNRKTERITIDIDLSFSNYMTGESKNIENLMILELKQDGWQHSDFRDILMEMHIKSLPFSKYCMGTVLTNPKVKYNRFKSRWITINKLIQ